jgi:hypothetical protein
MRFRFTIRDLLWLTLVIGILIDWRLSLIPKHSALIETIATDYGVIITVDRRSGRVRQIDLRAYGQNREIRPATCTSHLVTRSKFTLLEFPNFRSVFTN